MDLLELGKKCRLVAFQILHETIQLHCSLLNLHVNDWTAFLLIEDLHSSKKEMVLPRS
jgi:hypothetical protein